MSAADKPLVLCVDDEADVLKGLSLHLRRDYTLLTATSGEEALQQLEDHPHVAAIISDMRMPIMDGAAFLARARRLRPNATRILLTGYADMDAAIRAVNQGHLFRFLTKPCPPQELKTVVKAGVAQHQLLLAEHELLEQTLYGSVKALAETLTLAAPEIYGSLSGVHALAKALARIAGIKPAWPLHIASMLAYLGMVNLPRDVALRAVDGEALTGAEAKMVAQAPQTAAQLLSHIPRLDPVRSIIRLSFGDESALAELNSPQARELVEQSAHLLKLAMDFHRRQRNDQPAEELLQQMRAETGYSRQALDCLALYLGEIQDEKIVEIPVAELRIGMTLAEGLRTRTGVLLAAKEHVVTEHFLRRVHNFAADSLMPSIKVRLRDNEDEIDELPSDIPAAPESS